MTITATLDGLKNNYANYLQKANPDISPRAPNSYWDIQGGAMAAMFLDWYGKLQLLENSIYPQNSVGDQVDLWLYNRGLVERGGQTYSTINCLLTSGTLPINIPAGTIFTDSQTLNTNPTGQQYQALTDITVTDHTAQFTLYAIQPGLNYLEPIGNKLTATIPEGGAEYQVKTQSCANGQIRETDQSCIARVLMSIRVPKAGARTTDYFEFCLEANELLPSPIITDAIIIPGFQVLNSVLTFAVFPLVGTKITEYQLNQGLLLGTNFIGYSRTPAPDVRAAVEDYIQSQRLVGLPVTALPNYTYLVAGGDNNAAIPHIFNNANPPLQNNPDLEIKVSLVSNSNVNGSPYSLTTPININSQDQDGNPIVITLQIGQLIAREVRRAICNQLFGASPQSAPTTPPYRIIPASSIITALNYQLGANAGQLAKVLTNIQLPNGDLAVPTYTQAVRSLYYTYDINSYANISVGNIT